MDARHRLVEQQHPRLGHQRAHDLDQPALAAAEVAGVAVGVGSRGRTGSSRACALAIAAASSARQYRGPASAPRNESPRLRGTADSRFSSTVSRLNSLASWKVRTRPSRARRYAGRPRDVLALVADVPRGDRQGAGQHGQQGGLARAVGADQPGQRAAPDARRRPRRPPALPRTRGHVDGLAGRSRGPAELGGGRGGRRQRRQRRRRRRAAAGRGAATAEAGGRGARPDGGMPQDVRPPTGRPAGDSVGGLDHPLALRQDALRPHPQEDHDQQPDRHPLQRRDQVRRQAVRGGDVAGDLLEADRHQDRPEDRAEVVAGPADDHRREQHHGLGVAPRGRRPGGDVGDQDAAAEPGDGPADHQHRRAEREQVLAQGVGDDVVVPHGAQASGRTATR